MNASIPSPQKTAQPPRLSFSAEEVYMQIAPGAKAPPPKPADTSPTRQVAPVPPGMSAVMSAADFQTALEASRRKYQRGVNKIGSPPRDRAL